MVKMNATHRYAALMPLVYVVVTCACSQAPIANEPEAADEPTSAAAPTTETAQPDTLGKNLENFPKRPCAFTVAELAPQSVPHAGGLILAIGCGFRGLRAVRVHADALAQTTWLAVPFVVLDDAHVLFYSGKHSAEQLGAVWFLHEHRTVQRFFGWDEK